MRNFELSEILEQVQEFTRKIPAILRRVPLTIDLADEIAHVMVVDDSPFTMAVVGQMRVGKSTLINALVGQQLALTGVTETTATINWFRHGTAEQASTFSVAWRDQLAGSLERRELSELDQWVGDSDLARRTRYLEFYSTAKFLKNVRVVDTPGRGSVLDAHEDTLRGFLAERHEQDTLYYGGTADCIVYVLNPIAKEGDDKLLEEFSEKTRLSGSSPFNSVAVVHKWETLNELNPLHEAHRKAARIAEQLRRHVADVIPVSGPLAQAAARLPVEFWSEVADLVTRTSPEALDRLLKGMPGNFGTRQVEGCPVHPPDRELLRQRAKLPWPCFTAVLRLAAAAGHRDGATLLAAVQEASGIERLMGFLHRRFFDRSRVIRAFNLLAKALVPCDTARRRLRDHFDAVRIRADQAAVALRDLDAVRNSESLRAAATDRNRLAPAHDFLSQATSDLVREANMIECIQRELENEVRAARETFEQINRDFEAIRLHDDQPDRFGPDEGDEILHILGANGYAVERRLSWYARSAANSRALIASRLSHWRTEADLAAGPRRRILLQVVNRLEEAIDTPGSI